MSNSENETLNDVAAVMALEGLTPSDVVPTEAGLTPLPFEPLTELEQLKRDVLASGDPALIDRFEKMAKARAELEAQHTTAINQGITLVAGHELDYIEAMPNEVWLLWSKMSHAERLAFTARVKEQEAAGPFAGLSDLLMQGMEGDGNAHS